MDNQKPKILVVDDEPAVLFTTTSILEMEGYDVEGAASGTTALEAIRQRHYDLVLTDLNMPGIDGLAVLAEVRKRSPNTVTVMITGYGSVDSALEALHLGAYEYLLKPVDIADLKLAVRRSLERKRLSEIDTLYRVSRAITNWLDLETIAAEVSQAVRNVLGLANACLVSFERDRTPKGCGPELRRLLCEPAIRPKLASGAVLTAADCGEAAAILTRDTGIQSWVLVPGVANAQLACVLCADNGPGPYDFHPWAQRFLQGLASQAALAVQNAALVVELKNNNDEMAAANEKLRELDALKSKFLSVATHELRTPLSIILGYNSMLAESLHDRLTAEEKQTLDESVAACKRLIRLVNSMLDLNQIQAGKMPMNFTRPDLRRVVNGVIALFQPTARKRDLRLTVEFPARLPRACVDAERIQQVLINLVGNAVKFTPPRGLITVSVRHQPQQKSVEIAVRDSGIGIPEHDQARIFDEFAQVHRQAARRQREGSGLGLAIAKRIVEAHEGAIEVRSSPGKGSTFTFRLPVKATPKGFSASGSA